MLKPYYTYAYQDKETIKTQVTQSVFRIAKDSLNVQVTYAPDQEEALRTYNQKLGEVLGEAAHVHHIIPTLHLN